jgi:hypothetical protein
MVKIVKNTLLPALVIMMAFISGCHKEDQDVYSGTATIDNILYGQSVYYAIGFSFEEAKLLPTHEQPQPDITVHAITDNGGAVTGAYLDTPVLVPPFYLAGEFGSSNEAIEFYNNLAEVGNHAWVATASPVTENQVWLFRTASGNYVKFRVISITLEDRQSVPYVKIKFEWRLQPGGSTTFTG